MPIKRFTPVEAKERRDKGLCYNCDEKFLPGYKCKVQKLILMEGNWPADTSNEDEGKIIKVEGDELSEDYHLDSPEISLYAIIGTNTPQTMKIIGRLGKEAMVVLVDSGSTHNFLDPSLAYKAGLWIMREDCFEVAVANGDIIPCLGRCDNVKIKLQNVPILANFYLLKLGGCDAVLGAQWLQKLGPITWDFKNLIKEFTADGKPCKFVGESLEEMKFLESKDVKETNLVQKCNLLLQICSIDGNVEVTSSHPVINQILREFEDVFEEPHGLPHPRQHDHGIPLLPGTKSISV